MALRFKQAETARGKNVWSVQGRLCWEEDNAPVTNTIVQLYIPGRDEGVPLGSGQTDQAGSFTIQFKDATMAGYYHQGYEAFFVVIDRSGRILLSTRETPLSTEGWTWQVFIRVPKQCQRRLPNKRFQPRPQIRIGSLNLDAEHLAKVTPEDAYNIARLIVKEEISERSLKRIKVLSPDMVPENLVRRTGSLTPLLATLDALIKYKKWPPDVVFNVDRIINRDILTPGATNTVITPNFIVTYDDSGPDAVDLDTSMQHVSEPGSSPPIVIATLPPGNPPTYIKRICYWLEKALNIYVSPPFSMLNPAAGGKIRVHVGGYETGGASRTGLVISSHLDPDKIGIVVAHEVFHMVQFQYWEDNFGYWRESIVEGGATLAENEVVGLVKSYLSMGGIALSRQNISVMDTGYVSCLFWRYIAEQQSSDINEPFVGVETYRKIIERSVDGKWSTNDVKAAVRDLPWHQDFYEFVYQDPSKLDLTSSETVFGNYALACYLKDMGVDVPDRRFDFMEDEKAILFNGIDQPFLPSFPKTTLASVNPSGVWTLIPTGTVSFTDSVNRFASRYYEVAIELDVTNIKVQFTGSAGLTGSIFQIVLIEEDGNVRDIHRTDASSYTKHLTNLCEGKHLSRIVLVVSGTDSGGSYSLNVASANPAPDVMITRWNSVIKTEYEIDSFDWAWTWVSPDVWVDNDEDGVADGELYLNYNNKLHIRLHNKGNVDASGIQVDLYYQCASGGLSPEEWLPVQNKDHITQVINVLSLAAGNSQDCVVDWSPVSCFSFPFRPPLHFCVRAIVTVPEDPNTDNKRALSNFGDVKLKLTRRYAEIPFLRRHFDPLPKPVTMRIVPRLTPQLHVSLRSLIEQEVRVLEPGEASLDTILIEYQQISAHFDQATQEKQQLFNFTPVKHRVNRPDPFGYYKTDTRSLPPGVAGKPMVTIFNEVDGCLIGGVTYLVTVDETK